MAKKINDIIRESVKCILTEQKKSEKLNPFSPTNPNNIVDKKDAIGDPWPADVPRKKYIPQLESFFKTIGANPHMEGKDPTGQENTYPIMVWNYASSRFRFRNDHTAKVLKPDGKIDTLYWKYIHKPVTAKFDPSTQVYSIQETIRNSDSDIINEQGQQYLAPDVVLGIESAQLSQNGTGKIVVSKISGGEAEFTIYISVSGQPTIIYQKDQAAIAKQANWNKKKEKIRASMDILGWIPYAGDVLDVVQASWYFYDYARYGDWTNLVYGGLNLIAAIPYVGSGVKAVSKPIVKRFSKIDSKLVDELAAAVKKQAETTKLNRGEAELAQKTAKYILLKYLNYSTTLKQKLKLNVNQLRRWEQIEEHVATLYKKVNGTFDDIIKAEKHGIDLATGTVDPKMIDKLSSLIINATAPNKKNIPKQVVDGVVESVGLMKKSGGTIAKIGKFLSKLSVTNAQARTVYKNLTMSFEKQILRSLQEGGSEFTARLIATSTPKQQTELFNLILNYIPKTGYDDAGRLINPRRFAQFDFANVMRNGQANLKYWEELMHKYITQDLDVDFAEAMSDYFIKNNNVIWLKILNDPLKQLQNVLPTTGKEAAAILLQNLTLARKWLRIWFDIIHDASYDAGLPFADSDEQSLIYQTLKEKLVSEQQQEVMKNITKFITKPAGWLLPDIKGTGGTDIYNIPGYNRKDQWIDPATSKATPKSKAVGTKAKSATNKKAKSMYDKSGNVDASQLKF